MLGQDVLHKQIHVGGDEWNFCLDDEFLVVAVLDLFGGKKSVESSQFMGKQFRSYSVPLFVDQEDVEINVQVWDNVVDGKIGLHDMGTERGDGNLFAFGQGKGEGRQGSGLCIHVNVVSVRVFGNVSMYFFWPENFF